MSDKEAAARQWLNWHQVWLETPIASEQEAEAIDMMHRLHRDHDLTYDDIHDARVTLESEGK